MGFGKVVSDRELQKSVDRKLMQRGNGAGCKVSGVVAAGAVTLSGTIGNESQRRPIVSAMNGISGIKRVNDSITLTPPRKRV